MSESEERPDGAQGDSVADVGLIDEMLRMSPSERLRQNDRMAALAVKLRDAFVATQFQRRRSSSLSDAELMLIDPMFNARVSINSLSADNYAALFNMPYTHGLSGDLVRLAVERLVRAGHLAVDSEGSLGLTSQGGELWETERNPDWNRYCAASEDSDDDDDRICSLEVTAVAREIGDSFLEVAAVCGMYPQLKSETLLWKCSTKPAIYWKPTLSTWTAAIHTRRGDWASIDRVRFQQSKIWWTEISDLTKDGATARR